MNYWNWEHFFWLIWVTIRRVLNRMECAENRWLCMETTNPFQRERHQLLLGSHKGLSSSNETSVVTTSGFGKTGNWHNPSRLVSNREWSLNLIKQNVESMFFLIKANYITTVSYNCFKFIYIYKYTIVITLTYSTFILSIFFFNPQVIYFCMMVYSYYTCYHIFYFMSCLFCSQIYYTYTWFS